jgi:hypothetical protein
MHSQATLILIDYHGNPVKIDDPAGLLSTAITLYNTVMTNWYQEYTNINLNNT